MRRWNLVFLIYGYQTLWQFLYHNILDSISMLSPGIISSRLFACHLPWTFSFQFSHGSLLRWLKNVKCKSMNAPFCDRNSRWQSLTSLYSKRHYSLEDCRVDDNKSSRRHTNDCTKCLRCEEQDTLTVPVISNNGSPYIQRNTRNAVRRCLPTRTNILLTSVRSRKRFLQHWIKFFNIRHVFSSYEILLCSLKILYL